MKAVAIQHKVAVLRTLSALMVAVASLTLAVPAEGRGIAGRVAGAAAKRISGQAVAKSVARVETHAASAAKPKDVVVSRQRYPQAAEHIDKAQKLGEPTILTLDRAGAQARRREALRGLERRGGPQIKGRDRDEYPMSMTREGGRNADVRYVDAGDNRGVGKYIERQVRDVPEGSRIRILIGD